MASLIAAARAAAAAAPPRLPRPAGVPAAATAAARRRLAGPAAAVAAATGGPPVGAAGGRAPALLLQQWRLASLTPSLSAAAAAGGVGVGGGVPRRAASSPSGPPAKMHDDFKPVPAKDAQEDGDIRERIKEELDAHKVVLFMKGLPSAPACGFSYKAVSLLAAARVEYRAHNVLADDALRAGVKAYSSWPTIPQLYIGGEFVGGSDIVEAMAASGELREALIEAGAYGDATPPPPPPSAAVA
ncbi:hypothetical protein I4F81_003125 [Pyropia yezoensis]|uniref:Uncharacterized protein n=1 Tax=Pyropia yezoensis TaxID=2788 RepID=A0ACC3BRB4_PYRYE|nr:hypothetical protein I4F81_003125 [Neopyropia yezoensis]